MASAVSAPRFYLSTWAILRAMAAGQKFDAVGFARMLSDTYGAAVLVHTGPVIYWQFADPEALHEMLVEKVDQFYKAARIKRVFKPFVGEGLLTSEGDFWKRQRRLSQPAFHFKRIESYAQTMVEHTTRMLDTWRNGETRSIDQDMMKLTLGIVAKTLFSADVSGDAERVGVLLTDVLDAATRRMNAIVSPPDWFPTPRRLRQRRSVRALDAIIQRVIGERQQSGDDRGDLLSMLLLARDDDGERMSDQQLRDEVMTLFLAGHETTAVALSWAWHLLATHPEAQRRLQEEVDRVLGGRPPTIHDLPQLPYTEMVVKETMRLYPPAPGVAREPLMDTTIAGVPIRRGTMVVGNIYAMHRSVRYYDAPDAFRPERFSPEGEAAIPRYAYLPFGGGPRVCIGNTFALVEARLILATMAQRFHLTLAPGQDIQPEQLITLRPGAPILMRLERRAHRAAD